MEKKFLLLIIIMSFFFLVLSSNHAAYSANPTFPTIPANQSANTGSSTKVQLSSFQNNTYLVWQDNTPGNNEIFFKHSIDGGNTFLSTVNLSNSSGASSINSQIAASGSNAFVVWQEGNDVDFMKITNNGTSFGGILTLSVTPGTAAINPAIAISGSNIYVTWQDDSEIYFAESTNNGASFLAAVNLSNNAGLSALSKIAASGNNVYVAWKDFTPAGTSPDILFVASTDNGTSFGSQINLSNNTGTSDTPQITAAGTNVYVAWKDNNPGNNEILFKASTNSGSSFGSVINLSSTTGVSQDPALTATGNNVYAVWDDSTTGTTDIYLKASTNNGASFGSLINMSKNSGSSLIPRIAASGTDVYVTWKDSTSLGASKADILFSSSINSGSSFDNPVDISNDGTTASNTPQVAISGTQVIVAWEDPVPSLEILTNIGTPSQISVAFDNNQYRLTDTATLTINDTSSNLDPVAIDTITPVTIKSSSDATGITLTLSETGVNTGVFSDTINFTSGSSSSVSHLINAAPGDTITASFGPKNGAASIFPRTVSFVIVSSPNIALTSEDRGSLGHIKVDDQNSNLDPAVAETITVHVTSTADPSGIDIDLNETGSNTGLFGIGLDNVVFMDGNSLFPTSGTITITQNDTSANMDSAVIDSTTVNVNSTSDMTLNSIPLTETGVNTSIFTGTVTLTNGSSVAGSAIQVAEGDIISFSHPINLLAASNGLITPNPHSNIGAIQVATPGADNVTVSYLGASNTFTVSNFYSPGGGSGGIVRPGLVLNFLAGLSASSHGGSSYVPPSLNLNGLASVQGGLPDYIRNQVLNHDPYSPLSPSQDDSFDFPFYIDGGGYVIAGHTSTLVTRTESVGTPVNLKLNIPSSNLQHVALYTNLRGTARDVSQSDTFIIYEKNQPLQITDPHGFISHVSFDLAKTGNNNVVKFDITFAKPMEKSDIDLRVWDNKLSTSETRILDAWQVEPQSLTAQSQTVPTTIPTQNTTPVSENKDLIPAIKDWGGYSPTPISDSEFLSQMGMTGQSIPKWVAAPAKYVVDGELTAQEFENIVKYLASQGIVK